MKCKLCDKEVKKKDKKEHVKKHHYCPKCSQNVKDLKKHKKKMH